jgi:hypothetical protein
VTISHCRKGEWKDYYVYGMLITGTNLPNLFNIGTSKSRSWMKNYICDHKYTRILIYFICFFNLSGKYIFFKIKMYTHHLRYLM